MKSAIIRNRETGAELKLWIENSTLFMSSAIGLSKAECKGTLEDAIRLFNFGSNGQLEIIRNK